MRLAFHVKPEIADELRNGRLVQVLPKWTAPLLSVDALMPPRSAQPVKVKAALDALLRYLSSSVR